MERIEVGYSSVEGVPYAYHKYIIYTNNDDQQFIVEIHPQRDKAQSIGRQ